MAYVNKIGLSDGQEEGTREHDEGWLEETTKKHLKYVSLRVHKYLYTLNFKYPQFHIYFIHFFRCFPFWSVFRYCCSFFLIRSYCCLPLHINMITIMIKKNAHRLRYGYVCIYQKGLKPSQFYIKIFRFLIKILYLLYAQIQLLNALSYHNVIASTPPSIATFTIANPASVAAANIFCLFEHTNEI